MISGREDPGLSLWHFIAALEYSGGHLGSHEGEVQGKVIKYGQHISEVQPQYCLHC